MYKLISKIPFIKTRSSKERGDTIIEVLLAMTVIGLVLASSYGIANRSIRIGREAQERTEALKQVETQVERLRVASQFLDQGLATFPEEAAFCLAEDSSVVSFGNGAITEAVLDDLSTGYPNQCRTGTGGRYAVSIKRSEGYVYTIWARWETIGGGVQQVLELNYRIYPAGNTAAQLTVPDLTRFDLRHGGSVDSKESYNG